MLGRYLRRKGREKFTKVKSTPTKFKRSFRERLPPSSFQSPIDLHLSRKGPIEPIEVGDETMKGIEVEVLDLICLGRVSVSSMANALAGSGRVIDRYANRGKRSLLKQMKSLALFGGKKTVDESLKRRYEFVNAMNRLEKLADSTSKMVSSWAEAKEVLSTVIKFPDEEEVSVEEKKPEVAMDDTREKFSKCLDELFHKYEPEKMVPLTDKWKQVAVYPQPSKLDEAPVAEENAYRSALEKADNIFTLRITEAEDSLSALQNKSVKEIEERLLEQEREEEAKKRASSLMRPLTEDEQEVVRTAMYGIGPGDEVLARAGSDFVQRSSIQTLQPGQWLNDEVIHHFYLMLSKRDEEMCQNDPSRKRSHFFKSFFITKLLNEGHSNPAMDGKYEYRNVRRWSKKVPGKDIFKLDKVFFPINQGGMHWLCGVADITNRRVQIYDSMGSSGTLYLESIFQYFQDEHKDKKGSPLPDADKWELITCESDTPRQRNGEFMLSMNQTFKPFDSHESSQDMTAAYSLVCLQILFPNHAL